MQLEWRAASVLLTFGNAGRQRCPPALQQLTYARLPLRHTCRRRPSRQLPSRATRQREAAQIMRCRQRSICQIAAHLSTGDVPSDADRLIAARRQTIFPVDKRTVTADGIETPCAERSLRRAARANQCQPGILRIGQSVSDALVAIDAGFLAREQKTLVRIDRARALAGKIHRFGAVTVAAFERVVRLHARPFVRGELGAMVEKFFSRVDRAEDLSPTLPWRLASCARSCRSSHAGRDNRDSERTRPIDGYNARSF